MTWSVIEPRWTTCPVRNRKRVESLARKWDAWASENQVTPLPTNYRVNYLRRV